MLPSGSRSRKKGLEKKRVHLLLLNDGCLWYHKPPVLGCIWLPIGLCVRMCLCAVDAKCKAQPHIDDDGGDQKHVRADYSHCWPHYRRLECSLATLRCDTNTGFHWKVAFDRPGKWLDGRPILLFPICHNGPTCDLRPKLDPIAGSSRQICQRKQQHLFHFLSGAPPRWRRLGPLSGST